MKKKTIQGLGIATAVVAIGAVVSTKMRASQTEAGDVESPVLAVLADRLNDLTTVEITGGGDVLTLERSGADWTLKEAGGYPAKAEAVRGLLLELRGSRVLEEKTSNPSRFPKLGLDDPTEEGATSRRVVLGAADGEVVAELLVGSQRSARGGGLQRPAGLRAGQPHFVHPAGDGPALLASGNLSIELGRTAWVEPQFLNVPRDRVAAARITRPGDPPLELVRPDMSGFEFDLLDVPEGLEPRAGAANGMLGGLTNLRFEDVAKADSIDWSGGPTATSEFFTEHGLRVTMETVEAPGEDGAPATLWAKFSVDVDPDAMPRGNGEALVTVEGPALPSLDDEEADADAGAEAEEPAPSPAELAAEALELGSGLEGWAYALPSWKKSAILPDLEGLTQAKPEPAPEEAVVPDPGGAIDPNAGSPGGPEGPDAGDDAEPGTPGDG